MARRINFGGTWFEIELDEEGNLSFLNYNIDYDMTSHTLGAPPTVAVKLVNEFLEGSERFLFKYYIPGSYVTMLICDFIEYAIRKRHSFKGKSRQLDVIESLKRYIIGETESREEIEDIISKLIKMDIKELAKDLATQHQFMELFKELKMQDKQVSGTYDLNSLIAMNYLMQIDMEEAAKRIWRTPRWVVENTYYNEHFYTILLTNFPIVVSEEEDSKWKSKWVYTVMDCMEKNEYWPLVEDGI